MLFVLVTYDTPDQKRRLKMADLLLDNGKRVQGSVFELWLTADALETLIARLSELIDPAVDSVRLYRLCATCRRKVQELGNGEAPRPPGLLII